MRTLLTVVLTIGAVLGMQKAFGSHPSPRSVAAEAVSPVQVTSMTVEQPRFRLVRVEPIHIAVPAYPVASVLRVPQRIEWQEPSVGIARQLHGVRGALRACTRTRSVGNARVVQDVALSLRIDGAGKVTDLNPVSDRFGRRHQAFASCVASTLQRVEFRDLTEPAEVLLRFRRDGTARVEVEPPRTKSLYAAARQR